MNINILFMHTLLESGALQAIVSRFSFLQIINLIIVMILDNN